MNTSTLRRYAGDGTAAMITGTLVASIGNYAYQLLGGRTFGTHDFAPIGSLLTIHFLAFIIVLLPVEQLVIRSVTISGGLTRSTVLTTRIAIALTTLVAFTVSFLGREAFFGGNGWYAFLAAATVLTHSFFVRGRGVLASERRFRSYGESGASAAILRVVLAALFVFLAFGRVAFAAALVIGPLVIFIWPSSQRATIIPDQKTHPVRFLGTFVLAAATSQVLLLTGPLVAGVLDATDATISIVFVTFTLARAPLTFGYNLVARALPPFTALAQNGRDKLLNEWVLRLLFFGLATAIPAGLVGYWLGPPVVHALFGEGFHPAPAFAMLAAAGVTLAAASLFLGQILVARGNTGRLAVAWLTGVAVAAIGLFATHGGVDVRIGVAFFSGEVAAIVALATTSLRLEKGWGYRGAKRALDLMIAVPALLVLLPVFAVIGVIIRLDSKGPVIFRQRRVGLDGEQFGMVKFRTMQHDVGEELLLDHLEQLTSDAPKLKIEADPRITRVGRVLRKGSLDELPNLWNVIAGTMSLVGPRPLIPAEAQTLGDPIRETVKPGVTGLAQIRGRDAISPDLRNESDAEYVRTKSLLLDLKILAATVPTVFKNPGE